MTAMTREQFEDAYVLWAAASAGHKMMMDLVMNGKALDADAMHQAFAELERLHEDWMEKAKKFVHLKRGDQSHGTHW